MIRLVIAMFLAFFGAVSVRAETPFANNVVRDAEGAVIRGDLSKPRLSLIFTGDKFGESALPILDALAERKIPGGFFLTGAFLEQKSLRPAVKRMVAAGHYVGPHSAGHLLYADWDDRKKSLVAERQFKDDLRTNLAQLAKAGAPPIENTLFVPPYEWYNAEQVAWSRELGVGLINFTPGSGSNRDYAREGDRVFVPSQKILEDILAYEQNDPHGLNGFLLLLHLGSGRQDPFHPQLGKLCDELRRRGYEFVRVDELLLDSGGSEGSGE
jgi:peptidoglycan/xylan/chitin deacetylase (PgdA/CDA1 family)